MISMFSRVTKFVSGIYYRLFPLKKRLAVIEKDIESLCGDINILRRRVYELEELTKNLVTIGVDVHFREPNMILIFSHINGGQIRHIDANFTSMHELNALVSELKVRYHTTRVVVDMPPGHRKYPW